MATRPLRYLPIGQFLGDMESAEPITLPASLSSGGSKNLTIDRLARATSMLGFTRRNAAAVTSNTGAAPMRLRALYHYIQTGLVIGLTTRQELGFFDDGANLHYEMRVSLNGGQTWTFVTDLGPGYGGALPDFAQQGNALSICFGVGPVKQWDGTTLSDASTARLTKPAAVSGGAGQVSGARRYRIVPIKTDGTRKAASPSSDITTVFGNNKVTVTWTADTDLTVGGYEIYATTGSGGVASGTGIAGLSFLLGSVSGVATATFTDNVADLDLITGRVLQEYGDAPPTASAFAEVSRQRTWYFNQPGFPRRGYWSDPGLPYSVGTDASFYDFTDAENFNDAVTGGTGNYQNFAQIVWQDRSIWTVSGTGEYNGAVIDLRKDRSNARTGSVHHRTVVRVPAGAIFIDEQGNKQTISSVQLAYLTPLKDVRLFDGQNDTVISAPKSLTFARATYAARAKSFAIHDTARAEVTWVFPADNQTEPSLAVVWNYRYGVWYDRAAWATLACGHEAESQDDALLLLAGESSLATGGFCYRLWDGYTLGDGTTPVNARFETGTLYGTVNYYDRGLTDVTLMSLQKRWRWVELLVKTSGGPLSLLIEWLPTEAGNDATPYGSQTVTLGASNLETSDLSLLRTADGSQLTATINPTIVRVLLRATAKASRYMHARGLRLRVSSAVGNAQWSLVAANIAYQLLPSGQSSGFRR